MKTDSLATEHARTLSMLEKTNEDKHDLHIYIEELENNLEKCAELHTLALRAEEAINEVKEEASFRIRENHQRMQQQHEQEIANLYREFRTRESKLMENTEDSDKTIQNQETKIKQLKEELCSIESERTSLLHINEKKTDTIEVLESKCLSLEEEYRRSSEKITMLIKKNDGAEEMSKILKCQLNHAKTKEEDTEKLKHELKEVHSLHDSLLKDIENLKDQMYVDREAIRNSEEQVTQLHLKQRALLTRASNAERQRDAATLECDALRLELTHGRSKSTKTNCVSPLSLPSTQEQPLTLPILVKGDVVKKTIELAPKTMNQFKEFVMLKRQVRALTEENEAMKTDLRPPFRCEKCERDSLLASQMPPMLLPPSEDMGKPKERRKKTVLAQKKESKQLVAIDSSNDNTTTGNEDISIPFSERRMSYRKKSDLSINGIPETFRAVVQRPSLVTNTFVEFPTVTFEVDCVDDDPIDKVTFEI